MTGVDGPTGAPWWRDAVVYQLYVRSFADHDGDGIGDLLGIIDHLDHLDRLGVDALWLTPCFPSPQRDHGYDVADYFDIEPAYGDLAVFDRLVAAARERGIRILLDVVPNHCSDRHAWFRAALGAAPGSPQRARFYFRDGRGPGGELPPNNWRSVFGGPAWTRVTEADGRPGQWYLHTFAPEQPDWCWDSEEVRDHFDRMLTFWFDRGVDGFRVDAVMVVGKAPGLPDQEIDDAGLTDSEVVERNHLMQGREEAHGYWRRWRALIERYERDHPGRELVTVSEAYTPGDPDKLLRFVNPDQFHQSFNFDLMLAPWIAPRLRAAIDDVYEVFTAAGAPMTWTLNNHDTQRAVTRYGRANATSMSSFTGNNLVYVDAPVDVALGTRRALALFTLVAALPGSLYLYQGEELGLPEVLDLADDDREDPLFERSGGRQIGRDGCRIPLPWSAEPSNSFGFSSTATSAAPWLPQPPWWGRYAPAAEEAAEDSPLAVYRAVLASRPRLDSPTIEWAADAPAGVLAFTRGAVAVLLNTNDEEIRIPDRLTGTVLLATDPAASATRLPANAATWIELAHSAS